MAVFAINTFRLRPGVGAADFARFSTELDRPTCLAQDVVERFDVYIDPDGAGSGPARVVEVLGVRSWAEWETVRDTDPALAPVVSRFAELVDTDSVTTRLTSSVDDVVREEA